MCGCSDSLPIAAYALGDTALMGPMLLAQMLRPCNRRVSPVLKHSHPCADPRVSQGRA